MTRQFLFALCLLFSVSLFAQSPGDTIVVNTFNYGSTTRDTVIQFPDNPSIKYEKVLMLYNIRCKNGLVSPGVAGQTNIGCGEWDYSCNTYITDSSRVDSLPGSRNSHSITNFNGGTYPYVTSPYYNLYAYPQTNTTYTILNETQTTLGNGTVSMPEAIATNQRSGRSQFLFTQTELINAGVVGGSIDALILHALNAGTANFLKIRIKHTMNTVLNAGSPDTAAFYEVYYANTPFVTGNNRLQFHTPFYYDGLSNLIIDISFTNSTPGTALSLQATSLGTVNGLYANNGYFMNTASGITPTLSTAPMSAISNEITVMFWCRGNAGVSTRNTSIIEGVDSANRRQLNIHLPWSNGNVYFDCGNTANAYDRINKAAATYELEGGWQHWAFTKNTSSGVMNIYLNGNLWHTGGGFTKPINIDSLRLGANIGNGNNYYGDIDELTIWNKEISQSDIQGWMKKSITNAHPNYSNLVAYYKIDEQGGLNLADASVNAQTGHCDNVPDWKFTRGDQLHRFFTETTNRPNITFLQGNYTLNNTNIQVYDSLPASPNIVKAYTVISNAGTAQSDVYSLVSTTPYWLATYRYEYDGVSGALLDSFPVTPVGTINITNLPYMDRYPSKFEIMSFVTPYGINLDMGMNGKTWTFDMTDYLPILKGKKRMTIERGGEWQENMDIKFLFLVGTPARDVLDISQIWRQPGNCNYAQIVNDTYFEPRNVLMNPAGKFFKVRNMITGHGQEGEFIPRDHSFNINGGANEFEWLVYKKCAFNPLYPQGGTWIYDRAGWCPGMASDLKEMDITPYVTPGQIASLDYHMLTITTPAVGTSNYIVTNQLVTYDKLNFTLDAAVAEIMAPTSKFEYYRKHPICAKPIIVIQNTGSTNLSSLRIEYWINSNTNRSVYNWSGNLAPLEYDTIELSNSDLWVNVTTSTNDFHVEIKNPNGGADQYLYNNKMNSQFTITDVVPSNFIVYHRSNAAGNETSYTLTDEAGNVLLNRTGLANNTIYRDTFNLPMGCYQFVVTDTDEDGISFWANSDGAGIMRFLRGNGTTLKTFNPDFGGSIIYNFTIDYPLKYDDLINQQEIHVYPNPASSQFMVEAPELENAHIYLINTLGQQVELKGRLLNGKMICETNGCSAGVYMLSIQWKDRKVSRKMIIE